MADGNCNMINEIIRTERLHIRLLEEKDTDFIVHMRNQTEIIRYFISPRIITADEHLQWFREIYRNNDTYWKYIVEELSTGVPIGNIGIKNLDVTNSMAEIEYMFLETYQGKGFASEAVDALYKYANERWDITNFIANIHKDNITSEKLVRRLGFNKLKSDGDFISWDMRLCNNDLRP